MAAGAVGTTAAVDTYGAVVVVGAAATVGTSGAAATAGLFGVAEVGVAVAFAGAAEAAGHPPVVLGEVVNGPLHQAASHGRCAGVGGYCSLGYPLHPDFGILL